MMSQEEQLQEYGIYVGCTVKLIKDDTWFGIVKHIDENLYGVTTCAVKWLNIDGIQYSDTDDVNEFDIHWSNKLQIVHI